MVDQAFSLPPSTPAPAQPLSLSDQIGVAILVLAFILGFPGNLFVVWSVLCRVRQRSITCLLVLNLAVADTLVLLSTPFFLRFLTGGRGWEFGGAMCKLVHYLCCVNMYVSIYLICLMSADRWFAVNRPFTSQRLRSGRNIYLLMLLIWVMAFLLALPMPFYRSTSKNVTMTVQTCVAFHWNKMGHEVFQYLMETVVGFLIPFTLIVYCYGSVVCRLRNAMFRERVKGTLLIFLIVIAFAVFWLPYHLINIIQVAGKLQNNSTLSDLAKAARPNVTALAFLSSSVNPVLYVLAGSSHIRQAGLGFIAKLLEGTHCEQSSTINRPHMTDTSTLRKMKLNPTQSGGAATDKGCKEDDVEVSFRKKLRTLSTSE